MVLIEQRPGVWTIETGTGRRLWGPSTYDDALRQWRTLKRSVLWLWKHGRLPRPYRQAIVYQEPTLVYN